MVKKLRHSANTKVSETKNVSNHGHNKHESKDNKGSSKKAVKAESYVTDFHKLKSKITHWHDYFSTEASDERESVWDTLDTLQSELCHKYAWAVPDERALGIIAHFGPIIEIGCGKGLWAKLLVDSGVDVIAFDKFVELSECFTPVVRRGGPEKLAKSSAQGRTLLLCYPDEAESMASECFDLFTGDYIIHVGELMATGGTLCGLPTAPFGRTSSADFQIKLAGQFHCVCMAQLLHTYPNSRDCISVWKRTQFIVRPGNEVSESSDESEDDDEEDDDEDEDDEEDDEDEDEDDDEDGDGDEEDEEDANKPVKKLAAEDCEFISIADLAKLRGEDSSNKRSNGNDSGKTTSTKQKRKKGNSDFENESDGEERDHKSDNPQKKTKLAVEDCEFISIADLQKLRNQPTTSSSAAAAHEEDQDDDEDEAIQEKKKSKASRKAAKVISILREMLLDNQYAESGDTTWASIPATERLPIDCAIPSLRHLLEIN